MKHSQQAENWQFRDERPAEVAVVAVVVK